jgi:hypothetical protein
MIHLSELKCDCTIDSQALSQSFKLHSVRNRILTHEDEGDIPFKKETNDILWF